jgi:LPXTG-motif cell wall-anchored protein
MKRISRHTVVALIVALLASIGGMGIAVIAFGQSTTEPTSGYTTATTPTPTAPVTTPATTTPTPTTPSTSTTPDEQTPTETTSPGTTEPSRTHGRIPPTTPSRATRKGPTHLAFTGADPIVLGGAGAALMLAGLGLHLRRRKATGLL